MQINGFDVLKYNQYDLKEGAKDSTCPLCSHTRNKKTDKCAKLNWETGLGRCFHCNQIFQLHTYKKKSEPTKVYTKPKWNNKTELSDNVVKWFEKRHISQSTLKLMNITEGKEWMPQHKKEVHTIQYNYFMNDELVNIKYRTSDKQFKLVKDARKVFYNIDAIRFAKEVIIVEGENEVLAYIEAGIYNVVSVPNGATLSNANLDYLTECIEYFDNKEKIYLALDNDEAGQNTTKEFVRRLGADKCFLVNYKDCKDGNDYLIKYGKVELAETITHAKEIPLDGVSSIGDWREKFEDYLVNGMKKGYVTGIKSFDNIFSTYLGQYIVVTSQPSSGKSDFIDQMCLGYNKLYGWKTAYASPENKPNEIHAGKLMSKLMNRWANQKDMLNTLKYRQAFEIIDENFKFIDLDIFDLDSVLEKAKQLIRKFGIKVLVIDPYNKVRLKGMGGRNINDATNDYLIKIDNFARQNGILIILVAHPRKPKSEEGNNYEPNFYDIKGGGEFYDMSPHGLMVHRDYESKKVKVKVLKVKFNHLGVNKAHVWLGWDNMSGRYMDYENNTGEVTEIGNIITESILDKEREYVEEGLDLGEEAQPTKPNIDHTDFEKQGDPNAGMI